MKDITDYRPNKQTTKLQLHCGACPFAVPLPQKTTSHEVAVFQEVFCVGWLVGEASAELIVQRMRGRVEGAKGRER